MNKLNIDLPSDKILLRVMKRKGSFKGVTDFLGYNLGTEYKRIVERFRDHIPEEEWKPFLLSSKNQDKRIKILRLREKGYKIKEIAEKLNMTHTNVANYILRHMDEYSKTRATYLSQGRGHSGKPIHKLTNIICIKRRYIRLGIKEPICEICGWDYRKDPEYLKLPDRLKATCFPIQLDHVDGNIKNNDTSNHRFLCPNHHSLQLTSFRSKKRLKFIKEKIL